MTAEFMVEQIRQRPYQPIALPEPIAVDQLATPALVLDRPTMLTNIEKMAKHLSAHGKGFRPHAKTHKCPLISQAQIEAGAVGVCVAKVGEAVALISAGIHDVLITSPLTTPSKIGVVANLALQAKGLCVVVDSQIGFTRLSESLTPGTDIGVLIDLDVAMGRTGTRDMDLVLSLIEHIQEDPHMHFVGVQHYAGHVMHIEEFQERQSTSLSLWEKIAERIAQLQDHGIQCNVVTGGGTGTYNIDTAVAAMTDLQVGSYIFMDEEYRCVHGPSQDRFEDFEVSLHVACTTISTPRSGAITVDGGYKAFASDSVAPVSDELAQVKFFFAGDEHGVLSLPKGEQALQLGQVIEFVTPHCDPTVNLHDYYWVREADGLIHSCWPITARGCAW